MHLTLTCHIQDDLIRGIMISKCGLKGMRRSNHRSGEVWAFYFKYRIEPGASSSHASLVKTNHISTPSNLTTITDWVESVFLPSFFCFSSISYLLSNALKFSFFIINEGLKFCSNRYHDVWIFLIPLI